MEWEKVTRRWGDEADGQLERVVKKPRTGPTLF